MGAMIANADIPQVLVIDDEMGPRESLRMLLKPSYQVHTADSVEIGLPLLNEQKPDAIVNLYTKKTPTRSFSIFECPASPALKGCVAFDRSILIFPSSC